MTDEKRRCLCCLRGLDCFVLFAIFRPTAAGYTKDCPRCCWMGCVLTHHNFVLVVS